MQDKDSFDSYPLNIKISVLEGETLVDLCEFAADYPEFKQMVANGSSRQTLLDYINERT